MSVRLRARTPLLSWRKKAICESARAGISPPSKEEDEEVEEVARRSRPHKSLINSDTTPNASSLFFFFNALKGTFLRPTTMEMQSGAKQF